MDIGQDRAGTAGIHDRETRLEAARLLGRLSARAHAMLAGGAEVELFAVGAALRPYWKKRNLAGARIYQTREGWYAELAFKTPPDGLPPVMGTPAHRPCASEAEALEQATGWLATVLAADADDVEESGPPPPGTSGRTFHLDGLLVRLEARTVAIATRAATVARVSPECAEARLHLLLAADFPAGITEAGWDALNPDRRTLYLGWMGLLAHGQARFVRGASVSEAPHRLSALEAECLCRNAPSPARGRGPG
ncbi:MAG: hypothetical protein JOY66_17925 [Acetobacteraceae bacterium]|nr:hypothetical protein [Acetobacteraceae bacterium]